MILFYQISIDLFIFIIHHQVLHEPLYILNIIYNNNNNNNLFIFIIHHQVLHEPLCIPNIILVFLCIVYGMLPFACIWSTLRMKVTTKQSSTFPFRYLTI